MMTDPIADMLTRIRNAIRANHARVAIPASRAKRELARLLREEGYVQSVEYVDGKPQGVIDIELKYAGEKEPVISGIERVSTPGRRVYCGHDEIPRVLNGMGVTILSTSRGLMTDRQCRELGVGGEVLCKVW